MGTIYNIQPIVFKETGSLNVTSPFGYRTNPITKKQSQFHSGIDLTLWTGYSNFATIVSPADGLVTFTHTTEVGNKNYSSSCGNNVRISHSDKISTRFYHLKYNSICVKAGERVKKGQVIGFMGNTGASTGVHLHFEIRRDNEAIDPLPYLLDPNKFQLLINENNNIVEDDPMFIKLDTLCNYGDSGIHVRRLKQRCCQLSESIQTEIFSHSLKNGVIDDLFNNEMVTTLKKIQKLTGLKETGELDLQTMNMLNASFLDLFINSDNKDDILNQPEDIKPVIFNQGDTVKLTSDATYSNGKNIPNWVKNKNLYIRSDVKADGTVVVSILKYGAITGIVHTKYLTKI